MELTPEQQAKAKVLFEYEEAKKALVQRREDINRWGKGLVATGEALLAHPATLVFNGQESNGKWNSGDTSRESAVRMQKTNGDHKAASEPSVHRTDRNPYRSPGADLHHAHPESSSPHQDQETAPHCDTRYLNADRLLNLVSEFRELSRRVIELEQQKKLMGYFG